MSTDRYLAIQAAAGMAPGADREAIERQILAALGHDENGDDTLMVTFASTVVDDAGAAIRWASGLPAEMDAVASAVTAARDEAVAVADHWRQTAEEYNAAVNALAKDNDRLDAARTALATNARRVRLLHLHSYRDQWGHETDDQAAARSASCSICGNVSGLWCDTIQALDAPAASTQDGAAT